MATPTQLNIQQTYLGEDKFSLIFQVLSADNTPVPEARIVVVSSSGTREIKTDRDGFASETYTVETGTLRMTFAVPGSPTKPRTIELYAQTKKSGR